MKMPRDVYERMKEDMRVLLKDYYKFTEDPKLLSSAQMWHILHEINAQRSYADDHPRWGDQRKRVLEPSHVNGQSWLHSSLYVGLGLNDRHTSTALKLAIVVLSKEYNQQKKPS